MTELAEIFRRHGAQYREKYASRMPFAHRQAMQAIEQCRTEMMGMGDNILRCLDRDEAWHSFHSCKIRRLPQKPD